MGLLEHVERPEALTVGVVGCGAVGGAVCRALDAGIAGAELVAVCDSDGARAQELVWNLKHAARSMTLPGLIASCRLVVEATSPLAATSILSQALAGGCDVMLTNAVAVLRKRELVAVAERRGISIYIVTTPPPGLDEVRAVMQKPEGKALMRISVPAADAPAELASQIGGEGSTFRGTLQEAAQVAPRYENMIASFGAAAGWERASVEISIGQSGQAGELAVTVECSAPDYQGAAVWRQPAGKAGADGAVAMAAIAALRRIVAGLKVG